MLSNRDSVTGPCKSCREGVGIQAKSICKPALGSSEFVPSVDGNAIFSSPSWAFKTVLAKSMCILPGKLEKAGVIRITRGRLLACACLNFSNCSFSSFSASESVLGGDDSRFSTLCVFDTLGMGCCEEVDDVLEEEAVEEAWSRLSMEGDRFVLTGNACFTGGVDKGVVDASPNRLSCEKLRA